MSEGNIGQLVPFGGNLVGVPTELGASNGHSILDIETGVFTKISADWSAYSTFKGFLADGLIAW